MRVLSSLGLAVSLVVCPAAFAADPYFGVGTGISVIHDVGFLDVDAGYKVFGGARVGEKLAIEAGYIDFGAPDQYIFTFKGEYDVWALGVWAKPIVPVSPKFELFAKVGFAYWELDSTRSFLGLPPVSVSDDGNDFAWGLGAAWDLSDRFSLQLEYEEVNVPIDKAALWSVTGVFHF